MKWLIYGHKGWIGSIFCDYVKENFKEIFLVYPSSRADDIDGIYADLDQLKPTNVISFIGRTSGPGFPNIDYLEQKGKLVENLKDNLFSPLVLMKLCSDYNIHFTYLGTGCIFTSIIPEETPFNEVSKPNYFENSYSTVKGFTDTICTLFSNTLNVRIRLPVSSIDEPKSFLSKLIRYPKIANVLNSITVLDDAVPVLIDQIIKGRTGTLNLVNPEPIDYVTILKIYDLNHVYKLVEDTGNRAKNVLVPSLDLPTTSESIKLIVYKSFKSAI
jgi:3,5-epimerase/4-reductase